MITRLSGAPRLADMTIEQFQHHWKTAHADAAGKIPNLRSYVQNHAVLADGAMVFPYPGFDACAELDFDSVASMDEGFASETYRDEVAKDEKAFVDKTRFSLIIADRDELTPVTGGDFKLITFYSLHPISTVDALTDALRAHAVAARAAGATGFHLMTPNPEAYAEGRYPAAAPAATVSWWPSVDAIVGFEGSDAQWALSGIAASAARLLARPIRVV